MEQKTDLKKDLTHYVKKINFIQENIKELQDKSKRKNLRVLDVGCGVGNISIEVAKLGCNVLGIDNDEESIKYAKQRENNNCKFRVINAHELDIKEKFDVIIASEVLEHLKYPKNLISFVSENLDKDGFLFLSIPNGFGPSELSVMPRRIAGRLLKKIGLFEIARDLRHKIVKDPEQKARARFGMDTLNTHGEGALHEQFFTLRSVRRLFNKYNLDIVKRQNSFIFVGTFPFYYLYGRVRALQKFDCIAADYVPAFLSSGWSFIVEFRS